MDCIMDNVYIGSSVNAQADSLLAQTGIRVILNCAYDLTLKYNPKLLMVFNAGLIDDVGNPIQVYHVAASILEYFVQQGVRVLVCCHAGRSRSAAVVAWWMMMTERTMKVADALSFIINSRDINIHPAHIDRLVTQWSPGVDMMEVMSLMTCPSIDEEHFR